MNNNNLTITEIPTTDFEYICSIIDLHSLNALQKVNEEHLLTCWEIGQNLSSRIKEGKWGDKVVRALADYIRTNRPSHRGFSKTNIYNMVKFYETYSSNDFLNLLHQHKLINSPQIVQSPTGQFPKLLSLVTYTHHTIILNRCTSLQEKLFYILYAHQQGLNTRELDACITNQTFEALLREGKNMSNLLTTQYPQSPIMLKDRIMLDALALPPKHDEPHLHKEICTHMKEFILELGKEDFLFVQDEYPIPVGGDTFHLDLLFYHRVLRCYVGIELKAGKFQPKDLGQLEFYLEALDRDKRRTDEGPSIGILLCKDANQMVVEYALSRSMSPVMIAQYRKALIPLNILQKAFDDYLQYNFPKLNE